MVDQFCVAVSSPAHHLPAIDRMPPVPTARLFCLLTRLTDRFSVDPPDSAQASDQRFRPVWQPDKSTSTCTQCARRFFLLGAFPRKHHCRHCGLVFCVWCCKRYTNIPNLGFHSPARVCIIVRILLIYVPSCTSRRCYNEACYSSILDIKRAPPRERVNIHTFVIACPACENNMVSRPLPPLK